MTENLSVLIAFTAGLFSFFSPCVLPLVPSYLGILAGVGLNSGGGTKIRQGNGSVLLWTALGFILGFSVVFIVMGILLNTIFFLFGNIIEYINIASGIIVIILGLNIIFNFLPFLNYEKRPFLDKFGKPVNKGSGG
ncbi:MAG: cytochrome c biogenesis protein CcdA, partial [Treponema sp.]|nr:cytochrome c biogenesis protein CcdA [Treponema sp.]